MSADDPCKFRLDDLTLSSPCHAASVIHVAKIVEIVDQLFAEREASSWEFALPQ